MADYNAITARHPRSPAHTANARRYITEWKTYWSKDIPRLIATRSMPEGATSVAFPSMSANMRWTEAAKTYNALSPPTCR
jgi:hypothetical protein